MSNVFSKYNKELAGVKIVDSKQAYIYNPKTKKYDLPNPSLDFVGKIDTAFSSFILKMNKPNSKTGYVDEVAALPKRLKNELVNHFYDKNGKRNKKTKAYLARTDKKGTRGAGVVK